MAGAGAWVLTFRVDGVEHALPVRDVLEVVRMVALTPLPDGPTWLGGALNYRGRVIPVLDGRIRLGLGARDVDLDTQILDTQILDTQILVLDCGGAVAGLIVDEALAVLWLDGAAGSPRAGGCPPGAGGAVAEVIRCGDRLIVLLDAVGLCAGSSRVGVGVAAGVGVAGGGP